MINQSVCDNSMQSSPRSLWKFFRKNLYRETVFSTNALVDFLNEFMSHNWVSFLTTFVTHISEPIPEFSAPFSHTIVTRNIITVYTTQSTMNLGRALSFCMKKTDHSTAGSYWVRNSTKSATKMWLWTHSLSLVGPVTSISCQGLEGVEFYLQAPLRIHVVVLNHKDNLNV
jgi:hypothetical protein